MLSALINSNEPGRICDIVPVGKEFEVHESFSWVEVPDDTTTLDKYNEDGTITKIVPTELPGFQENAYRVARGIGYGSIGNQLDMLYHELITTGTISADGPWASHIATIKTEIPKDNVAAVIAWNEKFLEEQAQLSLNLEPSSNTSNT